MNKQKYTVNKALPYGGRIRRPGEKVEMHPREAKYYLGSHLVSPTAAKKKPAKGKSQGEPASEGGDS